MVSHRVFDCTQTLSRARAGALRVPSLGSTAEVFQYSAGFLLLSFKQFSRDGAVSPHCRPRGKGVVGRARARSVSLYGYKCVRMNGICKEL